MSFVTLIILLCAGLLLLTSLQIFFLLKKERGLPLFSSIKPIRQSAPATFEHILDSITDLVVVTDKAFNIKLFNPATERFFDCDLQSLINQPICNLLGDQFFGKCTKLLASGSNSWTETIELESPHGPAFIQITLSAVYNNTGQIEAYTFTGTDLTQYKRVEAQLQEHSLQLEKSNEMLEHFAYIASHDLKEPLRMVSGFVTLLERKLGHTLDDHSAEYFQYITDGVRRMYAIIESILDVSKLDHREAKLERVDVGEVLDELTRNFSATEKNCKIHYGPMPVLLTDRKNLETLFHNLIENGLKYNINPRAIIKINCRREGDFYEFSIKDNGIGIEPAFHEHIFKMFKRLHTRAQYEGTGMGLAISKRIVEGLGGSIWVETPNGIGSTFKFKMPVREEQVKAVSKNSPLPLTQAS